MKKNKIFIPKNILRLPIKTRIFMYILLTVLISLTFISLAILEGMYFNIKQNTTQNYNSHLSVRQTSYSPHLPLDVSSWWDGPYSYLEDLQNKNPVSRAVVKRTILPAIYQASNQQFPIQLVLLDNNDDLIFNNFMSSEAQGTLISKDSVHIGVKLAQRLNLKENDVFPIYIPSFNYSTTNTKVSYIYQSPDRFNDHYNVYVNKDTFQDMLGINFQKYHIRFHASSFISLVAPSIFNLISSNIKIYADDTITYQYLQLNTIKKNMTKWAYYLYFLCGLLLFLSMYLNYSLIIKDIDNYTYKTGFIPKLQLHFKILLNTFFQLIGITIGALVVLFVFIKIDPYISSALFLPDNPIFSELNLPLTYQFDPKIPSNLFQNIIPMGILVGMIAYGLMMFIYSVLPNFSDPKNKISYIALGFLLVAVLGFTSVNGYLYNSFADASRQQHWAQYFFGKHSLYEKNYLHYNALKVSPKAFIIPSDLLTILQENSVQYMTTLEIFGTASTDKIKKDVSIKALQGNLSQFSNILPRLLSNQVVIGKDVADYFLSNKVLSIEFDKDTSFSNILRVDKQSLTEELALILSNTNLENIVTNNIIANTNDITNIDNIIPNTVLENTITNTNDITNIETIVLDPVLEVPVTNMISDIISGNSNSITTRVVVAYIVDLPIGDFNNTIFINQTNLAGILKINPNSITKLQSSGLKKVLSRYTNNDVVLTPIQKNALQWKYLTNLVMDSYFISVLLQAFVSAILILSIILYLNTIDKNLLINYYIWGIPYDPLKKYSLIAAGSFILGMFASWLSKIILIIGPNSIPEFLQISTLTPKELSFSIDWISVLLLSVGIVFIFTIVYFIFNKILKNIQKNTIKYLYKDQLS